MHRHRNTSDNTQELLLTLGRLVDQALENIKLQRARAEMGLALQRHMLPTELPDFPGIRIGARYSPSQDGMAVGGDFYDAFPMRDGVAGITIGDVQGHGVEAAAFMGEARASLRALASVTTDPGTVLSCANDLLISLGGDLFTTCCLVSIAPHSGELFVARAGHVPIVWGTDDGDSGISQDDGGVPLGILHDQWYPVTRRRLARPGYLVLLTDGVVEGPSYPIDEGLDAVAEVVAAAGGADPGELAERVIQVADLTGHEDDAAVLVVRYDGPPGTTRPVDGA
ncbi:serine/threonine-protein phosphatase [Streptomyces sp. NBC_00257]|uniref:PP2C family protein-serine/threonine phosphatase n=1 Tax=unclassified Streptomyces TaxID=2593676 RepID=UPI002250DD1B|nr:MULTISPECIES: PP2C family protein-serine/threonine phosphatase [unclassified Streptomyces]MCX5427832.1 serine/threonine-protein phosphatase [Streptomyces sp. NBC_00062]WSW04296.1 serine/threonine-protein phosphatase [Streptomyces sp. NBC_01005]WTC93801.1 serine/threonine-protein phosphatase [Streptomyces sp. NBC_01650]